MKRFTSIFLASAFCFLNINNAFATTDDKIFTDQVYNTYNGTTDAKPLITNLKFTDVSNNYWAKEAITKSGALDIVKGYDRKYRPKSFVTNQEALAFALRIAGLEEQAQAEGLRLSQQQTETSPIPTWSMGYLSLARTKGLITAQQYTDATNANQEALPEGAFKRDANATREQVVSWVVKSLNSIRQTPLTPNSQQSIYNYSDWQNTSSQLVNDMEIALDYGIIKGNEKGQLNPKGGQEVGAPA